jgi:hypothetical protein
MFWNSLTPRSQIFSKQLKAGNTNEVTDGYGMTKKKKSNLRPLFLVVVVGEKSYENRAFLNSFASFTCELQDTDAITCTIFDNIKPILYFFSQSIN